MQIDWLTVAAQWINFLILMWLLRRFLYQPVTRAMDKRQRAIADRINESQQQSAQAERLTQEYRQKLAELESRRAELIEVARNAAAAEREALLNQARQETQQQANRWRREVEREKAEFQNRLGRDLGRLITATARKAVQDFSGLEWEQAVFNRFLELLRRLPEADKTRLLASAPDRLVLAASFRLDQTMQARLFEALNLQPASAGTVAFETWANSQCGLRLSSSDYSVEWSIEDYFADLDAELETMLKQTPSPAVPDHVD